MNNPAFLGQRFTAGVAYVIIPSDFDREKYIQYCFNTSSITIALENGGALNNVQCTKSVFEHLQFPKSISEMGSQVIWVDQEEQNYPVVIGIVSKANDLINTTENQTSISRVGDGGLSEVLVDGNKPVIVINCDSLSDSGGDIRIISKNKNLNSKININSSGEISLSTQTINANISNELNIKIQNPFEDQKTTTIQYKKGEGFTYEDEFDNSIEIKDGKVNITSDNINIGGDSANEPILLGDTTVSMIDKILEILGRTQTTTLVGPQPLLTASEFIALRGQLETLKSRKHKIE